MLRETTSDKRPSWAVSLVLVVTALTTKATSEQDLPIIDANWQVGAIEAPSRISLDLGQGGSEWLEQAAGRATFVELYLVSRTDLDEVFPEAVWRLVTVDGMPFRNTDVMGNAPYSRGPSRWDGLYRQ